MIDKCQSPHDMATRSPDMPAPLESRPGRSSSILLSGLRAFRSRHTETSSRDGGHDTGNDGRRGSNTSATRRMSAGTASADDEDVMLVLDTKGTGGPMARSPSPLDNNQMDADADDEAENVFGSSRAGRKRRVWRRLQERLAPKSKPRSKSATTMYSISFYPWKMEAHGYYSHPEAAANWVPDTASARCQICITSFSLTRRRHHCRLCGHLVCADCCRDRTYLPFTYGTRSQHRLIKDGAPQRTCSACASTLRNMAAQDDSRVKRFTVAVGAARRRNSTSSTTPIPTPSVVEVEVERPSQWRRRSTLARAALTDVEVDDDDFNLEAANALQLASSPHGTARHFPLRLSVTRAEELDEILSARAKSRSEMKATGSKKSKKAPRRQFVMSSAWLDEWLQYVRVDPASADAAALEISVVPLSDSARSSNSRRRRAAARCHTARPPRPGPVANYALLDFVNGELVPKPALQRSRGSLVGGDYRVVSQEVWMAFLQLYGGGPSIQVSLSAHDGESTTTMVEAGATATATPSYADSAHWVISELDDSLPALAAAPPKDMPSAATVKGAQRAFQRQTTSSALQLPSWTISNSSQSESTTDSTSNKRLTSVNSMSSLVKRTVKRLPGRREPASSSSGYVYDSMHTQSSTSRDLLRTSSRARWCPWEGGPSQVRTAAVLYDPASDATASGTTTTTSSSAEKSSNSTSSSGETSDPSTTIAAVSAFASAATLARQRSAMSLSRHSSATTIRLESSAVQDQ